MPLKCRCANRFVLCYPRFVPAIHDYAGSGPPHRCQGEPPELVAIIGYGNQGSAHAKNIRDDGTQVVVGGRTGSDSLLLARRDGFDTCDGPEVVRGADLVVFAIPDSVHGAVCPRYLRAMPDGAVAGFLHGFSVYFRQVSVPKRLGCALVAPKGPGAALRERYQEGMGIPCLLAIAEGGPDPAKTRAITYGWADAIGCGRAGIVETSFKDEAETDLFGEQAVLCGGLIALIRGAYETLVDAGYPPLLAYTECCHEVKQIADLICDQGIAAMTKAISPTAKFGALVASERILDEHLRSHMRELLAAVRDGSFAERLASDSRDGSPLLAEFDRRLAAHPMEAEGTALRAMLPWLRRAKPSEAHG
ncbi:MAG: ketol-acid reductoisomerase [Phycisphaerales bacterium]|nr:ketol-acid reductoisomerase [Phycisphaerales bacterium]